MLSTDLSRLLDFPVRASQPLPLTGGCISEVFVTSLSPADSATHAPAHVPPDAASASIAERLKSEGKIDLVVKRHDASMVPNFRAEADGLCAIKATQQIRVPTVHCIGETNGRAYLMMERIDQDDHGPSRDRFEHFGRDLAKLHRASCGEAIGWAEDNFLGSADQINTPVDSWPTFVAEHRIGFQLRWAVDQGLAGGRLQKDCEQIIDQMHSLLGGRANTTSLLHGDLWSGNYLFDRDGRTVLIDPAVYRGCREAEWGMISWFGNCPQAFEQAYQDEWPMPDEWQRRVAIYRLYHQLNHLNLFGSGYAGDCRSTASEILGAR